MRASSEFLGREGRCPSCKELVLVQAQAGDSDIAVVESSTRRRGSTDVHEWLAGLIGVLSTLALYGIVFFPLRATRLGQLFVGAIPAMITLVTCWGLAILVLKYRAVRLQRSYAELELELIPLEVGLQIASNNVDNFLGHLVQLPDEYQSSILGNRIAGALEHFKSRSSVPEVQQYLSTQAELAASSVDSGYTLLRVFIWAVPILGFIGTVMGISQAVFLLKDFGMSAEGLMDQMPGVIAGLSTAFDTTFIALIMAILLLFPTEALRRTEYEMLDNIERFSNESLLRRMSDSDGGADFREMPEVVRNALGTAFREHQRWLAQWQSQVGELGRTIGADMEVSVTRIQQNLADENEQRWQKINAATEQFADVFGQIGAATETYLPPANGAVDETRELMECANRLDSSLKSTFASNEQLFKEIHASLEKQVGYDLGHGIHKLEQRLAELVDRFDQMVSHSPAPDSNNRKKGILGLLRK